MKNFSVLRIFLSKKFSTEFVIFLAPTLQFRISLTDVTKAYLQSTEKLTKICLSNLLQHIPKTLKTCRSYLSLFTDYQKVMITRIKQSDATSGKTLGLKHVQSMKRRTVSTNEKL